MEMTWDTIKVDEKGNATAKVTMSRVKLTMEGGPVGKIEIDSTDKNEPDDAIGQMFAGVVKSMASMEMTFVADPTGEIKDAKITEGSKKKMKKIPGIGDFGGDMFGPDSLKALVNGSIIVPVPKEAVSKGKSWSQKTDQKTSVGKMTGETKYTYEGEIEKNGRKLEKFNVKPDLKVEPDPDAKIQMKMKGGSMKGVALFDNKIGRVAEASTEGTMRMEIEIGGMTIDMSSTQNTTIKLKGPAKSSERPKESPK
jgi:hypothetical protein